VGFVEEGVYKKQHHTQPRPRNTKYNSSHYRSSYQKVKDVDNTVAGRNYTHSLPQGYNWGLIGLILAGAGYLTYRGVNSLKTEMDSISERTNYNDLIASNFERNKQSQKFILENQLARVGQTKTALASAARAHFQFRQQMGKGVKSTVTTRKQHKTDLK